MSKTKHNIIAIKVGRNINMVIDGDTVQKNCETDQQADEFYRLVLKAKSGDEKDFNKLMVELNRLHRIVVNGILETDSSGKFYLKGFNQPIPDLLLETFNEYIEKQFPINAVMNFWKLLMLNPDKQIRNGLFNFLNNYKFAITDNGYFIAYKVVRLFSKGIEDKDLIGFLKTEYARIKRNRKSPKNYIVLKSGDNENYYIHLYAKDFINKDQNPPKHIGRLDELYASLETGQTIYTDKHNGTTRIVLGQPTSKERKFESHEVECSDNGLHVGSTPYLNRFYNKGDTLLMVLINPAHVIHVPISETTKLRTAEYYPYAVLEVDEKESSQNGKFKVLDQSYFETDYANFELGSVEDALNVLRQEEASNAKTSNQQTDYKQLLEQRLIDLRTILAEN